MNEITEDQLPRTKPYIQNKTINRIAALFMFVAFIAPVAGIAHFINGITQSGGAITVRAVPRDEASASALNEAQTQLLPETEVGSFIDQIDTLSWLNVSVGNATVLEFILARTDSLIGGFSIGIAAWLVRGLLMTVAAGDTLSPLNSRRLSLLALVTFLSSLLFGVGPWLAAQGALSRAGLLTAGPLKAWLPTPDLYSVIVIPLLLLALAEAVRQGGKIRQDSQGLI